MKKRTKISLGSAVALFAIVGLSSCTQSFCSNQDTGRVLYAMDPGITRYVAGSNSISETAGGFTYTVNNFDKEVATFDDVNYEFSYADGEKVVILNQIIAAGHTNGIISITSSQYDYFKRMDEVVLTSIMKTAVSEKGENITLDLSNEEDLAKFNRDVSYYSYLKYVQDDNSGLWVKWDENNKAICDELGLDKSPSVDFVNFYKQSMAGYAASYRTCLATKTDKYGTYGYSSEGIFVNAKSWQYAWSKGFFEGLLVYPIGWLIDQIAIGFSSLGAGPAALLSILFVTLIVRLIMALVTFRQTASNAKMTELQPEITKIQNKYPNAQTNQYEKQRMAQEMNDLYKKNKVNPLTTLLVMIVQFPVFICVWGALSGASVLTNGTVLGLSLSSSISEAMLNGANWTAAGNYAGVTAFFLFLLMAGAQTVSMLLPQWMQKARAKKVARLGKNPSQKSQDNKMKWVTYIMLAMIIFMGFSLVSAMGVYWFLGAVIAIVQTLITQAVTESKKKKRNK